MQGIIALDIDGTLTSSLEEGIPNPVIDYLSELERKGWILLFVTGRTFRFCLNLLQPLRFPFVIGVQNGATLIQMPEQSVLRRTGIDKTLLPKIEALCSQYKTDFVIGAGFDSGDLFFYRPSKLSAGLLTYLIERKEKQNEVWKSVESYDDLTIESYPSIKCFGDKLTMEQISKEMELELGLHCTAIKDPHRSDHYVMQATHPTASKGQALADVASLLKVEGKWIAAGDDLNDYSMLLEADIAIAMENSPQELLKIADIIAPSVAKLGIIKGLQEALSKKDLDDEKKC